MSSPLKTGILGAGRIASGFGLPGDELPLSLAYAVTLTDGLELAGFFDVREKAVLAAEKKWTCPQSPRNRDSWLGQRWDVICIATPDDQHAADLEQILALPDPPTAVLVEKPLCTDLSIADSLLSSALSKNIALQVNFPRRWHPQLQELATRIQTGLWGQVRRLQVNCSGGLLHNGSHAVDLFATWIPEKFLTKHRYQAISPCSGTLHGPSNFSPIDIILNQSVQDDCYVWDFVADFDQARITISGTPETLTIAVRKPHPEFDGFHALIAEAQTNLESAPLMLYSVENLVKLTEDSDLAKERLNLERLRHRLLASVVTAHCL